MYKGVLKDHSMLLYKMDHSSSSGGLVIPTPFGMFVISSAEIILHKMK